MARSQTIHLVACVLTVLAVTGARVWQGAAPLPPDVVDLERIPTSIAGYEGRDLVISEPVLAQLRTDALLVREYVDESGQPVWLLVDYHRTQRTGATVHSPRVCYPGTGWDVTAVAREVLPGPESRRICWLSLDDGTSRRLAGYWYLSRWGEASNELALKAGVVRSAIARRPSDAAIVRVSAPVIGHDEPAAKARLLAFVEAIEPHVANELPFRRAR